jgi:hypothetical protein
MSKTMEEPGFEAKQDDEEDAENETVPDRDLIPATFPVAPEPRHQT